MPDVPPLRQGLGREGDERRAGVQGKIARGSGTYDPAGREHSVSAGAGGCEVAGVPCFVLS
jgi:hypothetical protein